MSTVVVAGGAGFIGSFLCERLLKDEYRVICIDNLITGNEKNILHLKDNDNFTFINHDVTQQINIDEKIDAIFHLASPASPNHHSNISYHALPMQTMMVNTMGTLELLKLAKKHNAKFLFASTSEVYGDPLVHPQPETYLGNVSTVGPRSVYDEAKRFGETLTAYYWREMQVDARIVRFFNTYGPRMQKADMRMVIIFINQALEGKPITIFGDGAQTRSLCYITDAIEGVMRLMFYPNTKGEVINIGSDQEHTVLDYAKKIKELTGSTSEIVFSEALPLDDPLKRRPDISKAKNVLDWEPHKQLDEGLLSIINYFKSV